MHPTGFVYRGEADPSSPGGIAAVYRDLVADEARNQQVLTEPMSWTRWPAGEIVWS